MILLILDFMSYITLALMTIPAWLNFLADSLANLGQ